MTILKIKNEFGEAQITIDEDGVGTEELIEAFHGAMVALGYSNTNVLQKMEAYASEKIEDDKPIDLSKLDKEKYFRP